MYSKTPTGKNTKGTPSLESFQGRLRIRFRVESQQKTFSLGLADTPENRLRGETIARQMHLDALAGSFDSTLGKYKPYTHLAVVETIKPKQALGLDELWQLYFDFKAPQLKKSSMTCFSAISSHIKKLPTKSLDDVAAIQAYFVQMKSDTAKKYLININACCKWGLKKKLIFVNPFDGMASEIQTKRSNNKRRKAFTAEERDTIINAFRTDHYHSHYANYVYFLFFTGCRTGEAIGLRWKHISNDLKTISIEASFVAGEFRDSTKTGETRVFRCNTPMQAFLRSIKPDNFEPNDLVFPSKEGHAINHSTFLNRAWRGYKNRHGNYQTGIVTKLLQEGKISKYLPQYNTRHTFITLCLDAGIDAKDVANWVGNTAKVIYEHYADSTRNLQVPEL